MRAKFYIFFTLVSFLFVVAQNSPKYKTLSEDEIIRKVQELAKANDTVVNPKYEQALLQLKGKAEKLGYQDGILMSGDFLMGFYLEKGENQKVVNLGNELKKLSQNRKDTDGYLSSVYYRNALALGYLGLSDASLNDLKTALKLSKNIKNLDKKFFLLSRFYHNMGLIYHVKKFENRNLNDSVKYTYNKSIEMAKRISDTTKLISRYAKYDMIGFNYLRLGIFYLEQSDKKENLELAEKYLLRGLAIYEDKRYHLPVSNKTIMLNQMSWLYMEKKDYKKSIDFAKRALELEKQHREPGNRVESFEFLANSYIELGENEKSKFYMEEYAFLKDSIAFADKTNTNNAVKKIVSDVHDENRANSKKQLLIFGSLAFITIMLSFIIWRRKSKRLYRNYEEVIENLRRENSEKSNSLKDQTQIENKAKSTLVISNETTKILLQKLVKFEISDKFLRQEVSLSWLANQMDTNPKYLSDIIKNHRLKTFSDYINGLRVNYIIKKLYDDPEYRKYKISYLSEKCGYGTQRVFLSAFKKEVGLTPSYFIEQLKNGEVSKE